MREETKEELEKCTRCGLCKEICPTFKVTKIESYSPRGKILIAREKGGQIAFICTMCKGCVEKCPLNIKVTDALQDIREEENLAKRERKANKRMIMKIRKYGNPFGKIKKGKIPKELYCC